MNSFLTAGIGASAGGLQALQAFFEATPGNSGIAYVVILHLSPGHDSQLAQVLQHATTMPVVQVTEKTPIAPDHVYVIPPDKHLQIEDSHLMVTANTDIAERRAPVDIFFRSLADSHSEHAVGIILSGTGANGSMGLKRIKERGGAVFVQNPREALFSEMPRNAIATNMADAVLNVADIPARLIAYRNSLGTVYIPEEPAERMEDEQQALRAVLTELRLRTSHDFSNYKRPTILRRIERRIHVRNLNSLPAYARFLHQHPEEVQALLKDLLISVTNFFRDTKPFEELEARVLPQILETKTSGDHLRIWVAGCATGEEAYSIAMLCAELLGGMADAPKVQIFATDIDEAAIAIAREGFYTLNDAADVVPERLSRFFSKEAEGYRIRCELRETVLFSTHNLLKDSPFSRIDLISCRNLLIYLNRAAQERVFETFHFALKPGAFLLLGSSESVDGANDLFSVYNRDQHIWQSRQTVLRSIIVPENIPRVELPQLPPKTSLQARNGERMSFGGLHLQMLELYAPPSLIVNADYDIVHISEHAGRYLKFAGGEPTQNLLRVIQEDLRGELRSVLYQATQRKTPVSALALKTHVDNIDQTLNIHVRPIPERANALAAGYMLVVFETAAEQIEGLSYVVNNDEPASRHLEEEVIRLKAHLRASTEQHEFAAEELKAGNEELQAMNEELRSATEELETSKEELQSINEELSTVNQELKVKVEEASMTSNNLRNIINSTDIGTIILDRALRVVLFTPAARSIFNLIPADQTRSLSDITSRLRADNLVTSAEKVLQTLQGMEQEMETADGHTYLTRLTPYRTDEDRIQGVVISFIDITRRKKAENALQQSEEKYRTLFDSIDEGFTTVEVLFNEAGNAVDYLFLEVNQAHEKMTGLPRAVKGKRIKELMPEMEDDLFRHLEQVVLTGQPIRYEQYVSVPDRWFDIYTARVGGSGSHIVTNVFNDITARKRHEANLAFLAQTSADFAPLASAEDIVQRISARLAQHLQLSRCHFSVVDEEADRIEVMYDWRRKESMPGLQGVYRLSEQLTETARRHYSAGNLFVMTGAEETPMLSKPVEAMKQMGFGSMVTVPYRQDAQWKFSLTVARPEPGNWSDNELDLLQELAARTYIRIERARAEEALHASETRSRTLADAVPHILWANDMAGEAIYFNKRWFEYSGLSEHESVGPGWQAIVHPDDAADAVAHWKRALKAGHVFDTEYRLRRHDGSYRWFIGRNVPLYNEAGEVTNWFGSATDIEDLKQAQEQLVRSEERLRITTESAIDYAIINIDTERLVQGWSSGAERIFEYTALEMSGQSCDIIFTPEDRAAGAPQEETETARREGMAPDERWHVRKNGERFYMSGVMRPIYNNGFVIGYVKVARDMTRHKEAEETLRLWEERYRIALGSAEMAAWDWDVITSHVVWNDQHFHILGLQPDNRNITPAFFMSFIHTEDAPTVASRLQDAVAEDKPYEAEFRIVRADNGETRWMSGYGRAVTRNTEGIATRMVGVMHDITARKRVEELKDEFIGIASHELRTPVTSIKAYTEILQEIFEERGDRPNAELMVKLDRQVDRLITLIYALLDTTRITEGKLQLQKTDFEVDALITDTLETMQRIAGSQQLIAELNAGVTIHADHERIRQVLINLISNAIKYAPGTDRILIQSYLNDGQVTVCVQDFGSGIDEAAQRQVFDRFFRSEAAQESSGLGLGLYISATIVRQHGGSISVQSQKGAGARFCFTIPGTKES